MNENILKICGNKFLENMGVFITNTNIKYQIQYQFLIAIDKNRVQQLKIV